MAPDVAPTADPTSAPEAIFAALPDTPPAPPQVDPPAQTLPSQSAVAPVPEAPVPEAPVPEAPVPEAPIPVAPVPAAPVPAAEAAGSLIAKLPVPLAAPAADGLPAAAELPPPPPLMETTEAVLNDPQPQTLPQNAAAPPDPDVQAPVAPAAVGTAEAVVPDAPVAPADRMIVVEPPLPASEPAPAQTAEAEAQDPPPATGDAPVTPIKPRVITTNEGGLTERNAETADPQDDSNAAVLPEVELADAPPLERFAAEFENPEGKPLFGILLVDAGDATVNRQSVAALPFPVSIVIDPLSPEAAAHASLYRAGNKEVIMLASGIPAGATPADLEQTFQAHAAALPEAVAVVDSSVSAFQDDRPLATQIVPILAAQGRGLLTWDRGLNAADQVARREGLPSATIFRQIDAENESIPVMRRYLDRAAFQAAQNGTVIVIGTVRPETIAALLEWSIEGRSSTVALAPASAFLRKP